MDRAHHTDVRLAHPVNVSQALRYITHQLGCENWYVACHHEHLFVFRLAQGTEDKYAVRFECTSPVEKAVYHDSKAWSLSISPLHAQTQLTDEQIGRLRTGLAELI